MQAIDSVLRWIQLAEWVLLATLAANLWRRRRDRSAAWLAWTFASIASVVVAGEIIGQDATYEGWAIWIIKALVAAIVLFPYCLYRFLDSIIERSRRIWIAAHVLTGVVLIATLSLPSFPRPDEARPAWWGAWLGSFMLQWSFLLGYVSWNLWRSGRTQPAVARKRMRTMGTGAFLLVATIIISGFAPQSSEPTVTSLVTQIFTLTAGPFFLLGFAPPRILRAQWRRREEIELRKMEVGIVKALSREEIADALLPSVVNLLGGRGAALFDADGIALGRQGLTDAEVDALQQVSPVWSENYQPIEVGRARIIPMDTGWLAVASGPFTPFFGTDELQQLSASAVLADLALGRAQLYELETQAREAMRDFVAIASHDLRTPVTVIQGFSQLLSQQWDLVTDEKKRDYADAILRQVQALDRLIRDLLTVSMLDVNEVEVAPQPVDVVSLASDTVLALGADATVTTSGDGRPLAFADPDHVARMLQNYIKNAVTYGETPYEVEVVGRTDWVTVYVRDHGVGIPDSFVPSLFEKFARVDKKKSKAVQGTGLGLSIVRGLARTNGGDAWYEATSRQGTCFAFRLPRVSATTQEPLIDVKGKA